MKKILVILGPTSTGKTDLGLMLAKKFNGELVSCDSRQLYKGLDIGTGKMPSTGRWKIEDGRWIVNGMPIHLYDVVDPKVQYSVADYVRDANRVVREIEDKGKLPIVVGGSGLYLKALLEGLSNLAIPVDKDLRKKLQKLSKEELQEKLKLVSTERWYSLNQSDRENPRRLVRAIELALVMPKVTSNERSSSSSKKQETRYNTLKIGLSASREVLYKRVDERVVSRINQGMIDEAVKLHKKYLSFKRMRQLGLEYGILADYLAGNINDRKELIRMLQSKIHRFVRRQLTWFKKPFDSSSTPLTWFDITDKNFSFKVEKMVAKWYYSK